MILVTGASGFIGRHLLTSLIKKYGAGNVMALTSKPLSVCNYLLHNNYSFDDDFFIKNGYSNVDTIIHAGSYTPKNGAEANNWMECSTNIQSTCLLLKTQVPKLKRFIFLSTADVYAAEGVITETSPLDPISLYAHSKRYSEVTIMSWAKAVNVSSTILRIGHVYGPGEELYQKVIPMAIQSLLRKDKLKIIGTGDEVRSFIFVKDVVDAIVCGLESDYGTEIVNVAGANPITIHELFKKLIVISGQSASIEFIQTNKNGRNLVFDTTRLKPLLNRAETSLNVGLQMEWDYMKALHL